MLRSLSARWLAVLLLLLPLVAGCGPSVPVPDTPAQALDEGKKREDAAQKADEARSAEAGKLWNETATYWRTASAKFANTAEGVSALRSEARITDEKLKNTFQAWTQLRSGLRGYAQSTLPEAAQARADLSTLETKLDTNNAQQVYYKIMDTLVRLLGNNPRVSPVLAIIMIAVIVNVGVWPLRVKQYKSMKEMARYAPQMKELQARHKDDPVGLQTAMRAFQREHGFNPMSGCWPALLQMPVFILMYQVILHYQFHFQSATFLWITPSVGEASLKWPMPLTGALGHHLGEQDLLLLMVYAVSIFVQMKTAPPPADPTAAEQQKMMTTFMPAFYFLMMLQWQPAAAFVLYWFVSNLISMGQTWIINRSLPTLEPLPVTGAIDNGAMKANPKLISPKNQRKGKK